MSLCRLLSEKEWAFREFGGIDLGDRRLNRRAIDVAQAMARDPMGSIPQQNKQWKQIKGAYRLFDHERVTFNSVSQAHWQQTRADCAAEPRVLLIQDTTWLDYSHHPAKAGMGWHGPGIGNGSGLFLHSVLAVAPQEDGGGKVIGLAHGTLWTRTGVPRNQTAQKRSARRHSEDRESLRWSDAVRQIGAAAPHSQWLHVGDRESDLFDLYQQTLELSGVGFVIRVAKDRNACLGHDTPDTCNIRQRRGKRLKDLCRALPAWGQTTLWIAPRNGRAGRWARLNVSAAAVTIWSPQLHRTGHALRCWAVRVWEASTPADGAEPIEWMLLCSEAVNTLDDALRMGRYYSLRWLVEQYHQCLKNGCKAEDRQLENIERLEALIGMLSVVAVRLLQLKNDVRLTPQKPAMQCVPQELVQTLARLIRVDPAALSVRSFTHEVAKLGGFIGRKSDGDPGWLTLWRGWHQLTLIHTGWTLTQLE